jgi:hypothetical protein
MPVSVVNLKFAVARAGTQALLPVIRRNCILYVASDEGAGLRAVRTGALRVRQNKTIGRRASSVRFALWIPNPPEGMIRRQALLLRLHHAAGLAIALGDTAPVKLLAPSPSDTPLIAAATQNKLRRSVRDPGGSS